MRKKLLLKIVSIMILFLGLCSCEKEIIFDNNYDLSVIKPPSDVPFLKNKDNEIVLELINVIGSEIAKFSYELDYEKIDGDLAIKANSFQLIQGTYVPVEFIENKLVLIVKPISLGVISFKLFLKDSSGKVKTVLVQITSSDVPNTFDYTLTRSVVEDVFIGKETSLVATIKSTGNSSSNFYSIKYNGTKGAVVKLNNVTMVEDKYISVKEGINAVLYSNTDVGVNKLSMTVKNAQGLTKEISVSIKSIAPAVELIVPTDLNVKETIEKNFDIVLSNLISSNKYEIRFTTPTNVGTSIKTSVGNSIPLNVFTPIQSTNGKLLFSYLTNQSKNEVLTVSIRDASLNIVTKTLNVAVNPKPNVIKVITNSYFVDSPPVVGQPVVRTYYSKFDFQTVSVGSGETITEYVINNKSYTNKSEDKIIHVVPGTLYIAKIKDSSGRWSNDFTGKWGTN